jgi:hypothetical protein
MKDFITEVQDDIGEVDVDDALTFKHDGREVTFYKPSTGQLAIMLTMLSRELDPKSAGTFIQLFFELMEEETQRYFQSRLLDRKDPFDLNGEGGVVDIFESISEEWSGKDSKKPSDYLPSRRATGGASTAPSRAKASTSSRSRSRGSST